MKLLSPSSLLHYNNDLPTRKFTRVTFMLIKIKSRSDEPALNVSRNINFITPNQDEGEISDWTQRRALTDRMKERKLRNSVMSIYEKCPPFHADDPRKRNTSWWMIRSGFDCVTSGITLDIRVSLLLHLLMSSVGGDPSCFIADYQCMMNVSTANFIALERGSVVTSHSLRAPINQRFEP